MTRQSSVRFALAAAAIALFAAPAFADKYSAASDNVTYSDEIVVTAPGVWREPTGRRSSSGAPIVDLTARRVVDAGDLNLRYDSDVTELRRRIEASAVDACNEIDAVAQAPMTTQRQCVRGAVRNAMAQADTMIAYARG